MGRRWGRKGRPSRWEDSLPLHVGGVCRRRSRALPDDQHFGPRATARVRRQRAQGRVARRNQGAPVPALRLRPRVLATVATAGATNGSTDVGSAAAHADSPTADPTADESGSAADAGGFAAVEGGRQGSTRTAAAGNARTPALARGPGARGPGGAQRGAGVVVGVYGGIGGGIGGGGGGGSHGGSGGGGGDGSGPGPGPGPGPGSGPGPGPEPCSGLCAPGHRGKYLRDLQGKYLRAGGTAL